MGIRSIKNRISSYVASGSTRSITVKKNILGSLLLKSISILISLQVVPLTINYINPTKYGIWLTLSSIIAWLSYFDLGFAHGFRNRFAEARASGNIKLAKEYISTTYMVLLLLFSIIFFIVIVFNNFLNWSSILNIEPVYNDELRTVFGLLSCFFCLNIVASVFTTMLAADQKTALASLIQTSGQVLAFVSIFILTRTTSGSLNTLAIVFAGIPCFWLIIISFIMFCGGKYRSIAPTMRSFRISLIKNILGLGGQFFIIMLSMLFIFQFINIILSRIEGPEIVTQYIIAYKYFNILNMGVTIILTPFWSAFTDAYVKHDYNWMRSVVKKLELLWLLCIPLLILMVICSSSLYEWWIGNSVSIPLSLSMSMAVYILFQTGGNMYMYLINGTSKVRLQLILYLLFAIVSIPLMTFCCKKYGVEGVLIVPIIVFGLQAGIGRIQIFKIITGTARGIWLK